MQTKSLSVSDEVFALGNAIGGLIADIKAGKSVLQDVEDAFAALVGSVQSMQNIGTDIKLADNQAFLLVAILEAVEPNPVVAAPAASV